MTLSFDRVLKSGRHPDHGQGTLDILDLPQMVADRYGLHYMEFQHYHLASTESSYLREIRDRLRKAKSHINQICLEYGDLNVSSPDPVLRMEAVDLTKRWIDHAVAVGSPRVMLNPGTLAPEVRQPAIARLREIAAYARTRKVFVTIENRGHGPAPPKPSWEVIVDTIKSAGIYANPDTGNFLDEASRTAGLRAMYPLACGSSHVHYDPARFDESQAIGVSKEKGYKGLFSIEATAANGPDPYISVRTIIEELVKDI
jgi:sugar phosphate isomerase/epimerase